MTNGTMKMQVTELRDEISKFEEARAVLAMQMNHADGENLVRLNREVSLVNAKLVRLQQEINALLNAEMDQQANSEPEIPLDDEDFQAAFNQQVAKERKLLTKQRLKKAAIVTGATIGSVALAVGVGHLACVAAYAIAKRGFAAHVAGLAAASLTGVVLGKAASDFISAGRNPE